MDPAVLGTLLIGLEDTRPDADFDQQPISMVVGRSAPSRFAIALAGLLRSAADALEPARRDSYSRSQLSS
jgi:hypothetical protein